MRVLPIKPLAPVTSAFIGGLFGYLTRGKRVNSSDMIATVLGCGTSTGVPLIQCRCSVCRSRNARNKRLRASLWLQIRGKSILIDTATDLRQQALREKIARVDAVLYTHPHADHVHGIDELRSFNFLQQTSIPLYGNEWTCQELQKKFEYIFRPKPVEGGGIPELILHAFDPLVDEMEICGEKVIPLPLKHGSKQSVGYRIGSLAYLTDCSELPDLSRSRLEGLSVLILDCLRVTPHPTHLNLDGALQIISELKPEKAFLTHMGHDFDFGKLSRMLPKGLAPAHDGLRLRIPDPLK